MIVLKAAAVGVTGEVEPAPGLPLAVAGRGEQALDQLLVGVGRAVLDEERRLLRVGINPQTSSVARTE